MTKKATENTINFPQPRKQILYFCGLFENTVQLNTLSLIKKIVLKMFFQWTQCTFGKKNIFESHWNYHYINIITSL
jgi:hypothetical protein